MISVLTTLVLILLLFLTGKIFEAVKRFLVLLVSIFMKVLNLFGIQINLKEPRVKTSKKFKQTFKDIKVVKKSKQNDKIIPSINLIALVILIICLIITVVNITQNDIISTWLYVNVSFIGNMFGDVDQVSTTITATMFSIMAFSISKLVSQWRDTRKYRDAKRQIKLKNKAVSIMSSKELLDIAKQKDEDRLNQLMYSEEGDGNNQ